jgi:hypothetical protein
VLFLREKLEAQGRELERERTAQRHLAADLNRELHNLNKQKEAEVQAVRYRNHAHPGLDFFPSHPTKLKIILVLYRDSQLIKNSFFYTQKVFNKPSEIQYGLEIIHTSIADTSFFIPDPDFFSVPDPGSNKNKKRRGKKFVVFPLFCRHFVSKNSEMVGNPGSEIRIPGKTYPGSRFRGS